MQTNHITWLAISYRLCCRHKSSTGAFSNETMLHSNTLLQAFGTQAADRSAVGVVVCMITTINQANTIVCYKSFVEC